MLLQVRIVLNWDFRLYPVGRKAKSFLDSLRLEPIVDAGSMNQGLFEFAPALGDVVTARKKLNYLSAYLQTCGRHPEVYHRFLEHFRGREYLVREASKFAIKDLEDIKSGEVM